MQNTSLEKLVKIHQDYCNNLDAKKPQNLSEDEEWHYRRKYGIGGSEAATILGVNPYQTPYEFWLVKTGREAPPDLSDNEAVRFGNLLEDIVANEYARINNCKVRKSNVHHIHKGFPWLVANLDRIVVGQRKILECKTAGQYASKSDWGEEYTDEIPLYYHPQVALYMAVMDYDLADLAVLIGRSFKTYCLKRNLKLEAKMITRLTEFWFNNIINDQEPRHLMSADEKYQTCNNDIIYATSEVELLIHEYSALDNRLKFITKEMDQVKEQLKEFIGENALLMHDHKKVATWKPVTTNRFDTKSFKEVHPDLYHEFLNTTTIRRLSIKK